ncbi:50S ribosomal protein L7ae [Pseudomonas lundensis]|nr:50S ribosomal protein L7ae [Pseudomonas lundensis]
MNRQKIYSFLGLCQRAGKVVSGEVGVSTNLKKRKLKLVIIAEDASENTKKTYINESKKYNVSLIILGDKVSLGNTIGKEYRSIVGIKDKNMAENLMRIYSNK